MCISLVMRGEFTYIMYWLVDLCKRPLGAKCPILQTKLGQTGYIRNISRLSDVMEAMENIFGIRNAVNMLRRIT